MSYCRLGEGRLFCPYGNYYNETATPDMDSHMNPELYGTRLLRDIERLTSDIKLRRNYNVRVKYSKWKKLY